MLEKLWKLEGFKNMNEGFRNMNREDPPMLNKPGHFYATPNAAPPPIVETDERSQVIAQAHVFVEQWKQERLADKQEIESLKAELAEEVLRSAAERRRADGLSLDLATALNNIQTLQSQIEEYRKFMSMVRQLFDRWDIKKQPKKDRKAKKTELPAVEVKIDEQS